MYFQLHIFVFLMLVNVHSDVLSVALTILNCIHPCSAMIRKILLSC